MNFRSVAFVGVTLAIGFVATGAQAADDLIQRIKSAGVLRVCEADYSPQNFKDPKTNEWVGLNVDIAQYIADALKVKLESVDANWGTIPQSVLTGKCDMSVASTYMTPARAELVLFTDATRNDAITAFVKTDSKADSWADLDQSGKVIGVYAGSYEEGVAKTFFKNAEVKSIVTDKISSALLDTMNGRYDAYFSSIIGPLSFIKGNPQFQLRTIKDKSLPAASAAFMVPPGEYHFQQYVNVVLRQLSESGDIKKIQKKWLGDMVDQVQY